MHYVLRSRFLPQREIVAAAFVALSVQLTGVGDHLIDGAAGKDAVVVVLIIFLYVKIDRAVAYIGIAGVQDLLHEFYLLDYVSGSAGLD